MLRIFFSSEDIARTRVASAADPVWELILSLHLLQGRTHDPVMSGWRRDVYRSLRRDTVSSQQRLLFALNPPRGYFPDFLTPHAEHPGLRRRVGRDPVHAGPAVASRPDRARHRERVAQFGRRAGPGRAGGAAAPHRLDAAVPVGGRSAPTGTGSRPPSRPTGSGGPGPCSTAAPKDCWPASARPYAGPPGCWRCSTIRTAGNCTLTTAGCC